MGCRTSREKRYGFETIMLENDLVKISLFPEYGAKIWDFIYKPICHNFLYHHPRVEPRTPVFGMPVDNWWCGGIDECLPTGWACEYKGENLPDLGELWPLPWEYEVIKESEDEVEIYLRRATVIFPVLVERWMSLKKGEKSLFMKHKITNLSSLELEFNWGIHPTFDISPNWEIDIPAEEVIIEHSYPDDWLGKRWEKYKWPYAVDKKGERIDMRKIPPMEENTHDLHYACELKDGYLRLFNRKENLGIKLTFDKEIFKAVWLWLVYGGWRGLYLVGIEVWTGYPVKLSDAVRYGEYAQLEPNGILETDIKMEVYYE